MPTSVLSAVAAPAITAGVSFLGNKLFGSGSSSPTQPLQQFKPSGFTGGGLSASFDPSGNLTLAPTAARLGAVGGLGTTFGAAADEFGRMRSTVAPGVSDLRAQRLREIENARNAAVGNLRENLARRRVLGSSFGQDALTRAEAEFGGLRDKAAAESFLQEFEMTNRLIGQEFDARRQQFETGINELNLEAGIAANLTAGATKAMGEAATMLSALNAKEAEGKGKFFGQTFQPVAKAFGDAAGPKLASFLTPTNPTAPQSILPPLY